jgi:DNA repair exonuclease SbcCD nuclease subunit
MWEHSRDYRPLAGVIDRPATGSFVVMGHGFHDPGPEEGHRSSPMTPAEIEATGADYVALGHVHVRQDVSAGSVVAWYCGSPEGVTTTGTYNLVTLGESTLVEHIEVVVPGAGCGHIGTEVSLT